MDDANVPSLLSIPYLGWDYDPVVFSNTQRFILSPDNPYFAQSHDHTIRGYLLLQQLTQFSRVGSVHTKSTIANNIWPMAQLIEGLSTTNVSHKFEMLRQVLATDAGTGAMHESYDPNFPTTFTRAFFCWADALFAELVLSLGVDPTECPGKLAIDEKTLLQRKHPAHGKYFPR